MLNTALEIGLPVSDDEVTWVQVALWDKVGDRLIKFIGDRKSALVDIFGTLSYENYTAKDGSQAVSVKINAYDFWSVPTGKGQGHTQPQSQNYNQGGNGISQSYNGSCSPEEVQTQGEFFDYNEDDNEVPF